MLILQREPSTKHGTFGAYILDGHEFCVTLEPEVTGFPAGEYVLHHYFSPEHQFEVMRFADPEDGGKLAARCIENHPGNAFFDTRGCVLVGIMKGKLDCAAVYPSINPKTGAADFRHYLGVIPAILESKAAFAKLMALIPSGTPITVIDAQAVADGNV
jgi:hypothetical protein